MIQEDPQASSLFSSVEARPTPLFFVSPPHLSPQLCSITLQY
jgi:hypothetical protein